MRKGLILWFIIILSPLLFLACPSDPAGPTVYEKIVIDAYPPSGFGAPTIDVKLMYDASNEVPDDTDLSPRRVVMNDLSSGMYYIQVTSTALTDQNYVLRALAPVGAEPSPIVPLTNNPSDSPYETDDGDLNKNEILLGNDNYVNRYLDVDPAGDVDWLKLVLP